MAPKLKSPSFNIFRIRQSVTALLAVGVALPTADVLAQQFCSQTTSTLYSACVIDANEEFKVAQAICLNISDGGERNACNREARVERAEARGECRDVRAARDEVCDLVGQGRYDPDFSPGNFVDPDSINASNANPFFRLIPGLINIFEGDGERITVEVLDEIRELDGVPCRVVRDTVVELDENGEPGDPVEITDDYYAQHVNGDVWYCGELSQNFEDGFLFDLDGSFYAGIDGAKPGLLIPFAPAVGQAYRQEFAPNEAEDVAEVVALDASESAPEAGVACEGDCLQTRDINPLDADPAGVEFKYYKPGIGLIVETKVEDPSERLELVEVIEP